MKTDKQIRKEIKKRLRRDNWDAFLTNLKAFFFVFVVISASIIIISPLFLHLDNVFKDNPIIHLDKTGMIVTGIFSIVTLLILLFFIVLMIWAIILNIVDKIKENREWLDMQVEREKLRLEIMQNDLDKE